jgi:anti-sigma factor (TIGR02949 family)
MSLDCQAAMRQLWDYLDQELTAHHMRLIREHLEACAECHPHADFAARFLEAIRHTREDVRLPEPLRERVCRAIAREAGDAS